MCRVHENTNGGTRGIWALGFLGKFPERTENRTSNQDTLREDIIRDTLKLSFLCRIITRCFLQTKIYDRRVLTTCCLKFRVSTLLECISKCFGVLDQILSRFSTRSRSHKTQRKLSTRTRKGRLRSTEDVSGTRETLMSNHFRGSSTNHRNHPRQHDI